MDGRTYPDGPVAQLGARLNGIQEVTGSIPVRSTILRSLAFVSELRVASQRAHVARTRRVSTVGRSAKVDGEVNPVMPPRSRIYSPGSLSCSRGQGSTSRPSTQSPSGRSSWLVYVVWVTGKVTRALSGTPPERL
jgi:hypothetical protein